MRHFLKRSTAALAASILLTVFEAQGAASPGDDPQNPVTFKSQATLVQVPTVVTDKDGKHIHGLSKSDFRVLEDGSEEKIAVFEEVTASNARPAALSALPNAYTNLLFSGDQRCALTVVVFDAINTNYADQDAGRRNLIKYLSENLNAKQAVALMLMTGTGVKKLSGITDDPASLLAAVKNLKGEMPATEAFAVSQERFTSAPERLHLEKEAEQTEATFQQERAIDQTMRAFLAIAWSVSGVPGRKSLIWATGSFPFFLDSSGPGPDNPQLASLYQRTMEALNDAQISVYPVDVRGLGSDALPERSSSGPDLLAKTMARNQLLDSTLHNLRSFAEMTGGRAFYERNDLDTGFRNAIEDSSSYYLIGYYRNSQNLKAGWRKLEVKLARKDAEIRARSGFLVGPTTLNPESTQQSDETFALVSPFDSTGVPLLVRWNLPAVPKSGQNPEFAMVVPASNVVEAADTHRINVDFIWEATKKGTSVLKDGHSLKGSVTADALAKLRRDGVYYKNALKLPAGDYEVKFVVRDNLSGRIGSVTSPLTVK
jgi:VWFA-related protein